MSVITKIESLKQGLKDQYAERDTEIDLGILAVINKQHFLQIGPPGTAKSMLARDLAAAINGKYFWALMNRHMTPDQLFGPPDLKAIREEGRLYHVSDGMIQEAHITFLDEIFKCSSATLNALLTIMNEREFKNGDQIIKVPMVSAFAASNEMPSSDSEELQAFWDRFLLRKFISPVRDPANFVKMLNMTHRRQDAVLSLKDLDVASQGIEDVEVTQSFLEHMVNLRNALSFQGIEVSDRRWQQSLKLCKSIAWLDRREAVIEGDMAILQHVVWSSPSDVKTALRVILSIANPLEEKVVDLMDQVDEIEAQLREKLKWANAEATQEAKNELRRESIEWFVKLGELGKGLVQLQEQCKSEKRPASTIDDALFKLQEVAVQIGADAMGLGNYEKVREKLQKDMYKIGPISG